MKKIILASLLSFIILAWCNKNNTTETIIAYDQELVVAGIGPDVSFEPTVDNDILVLKKVYENHTDHLFFSRMFWDNYLDIFEDCIPGNKIKFDGKVKTLDVATGNNYYEVVETNTLEKVWIPNEEEVLSLLDKYNYCEIDADCTTLYGKCPLPCHIAVNNQFSWTAENIVDNFWNNQESQCMYKCMEIQTVKCDNHECIVN